MFLDWKYRIFIFTLFPWASVFPFVKNSWRNFENVTFHFRLRFLGVSQLIEFKWWDKQITYKTRIKMLSSWCMQCHFWTKSKPWYRAGNSMEKGQWEKMIRIQHLQVYLSHFIMELHMAKPHTLRRQERLDSLWIQMARLIWRHSSRIKSKVGLEIEFLVSSEDISRQEAMLISSCLKMFWLHLSDQRVTNWILIK